MLKRFNRLIFILIIVAATLYVALLNQEVVTLRLFPDSPITTQLGIIIISAFSCGMLLMSLLALWFGLQSYIRERAYSMKEKERQNFYQNVLKARSFLAAEEWSKAKAAWEQAIRKDPTHIISRVELSRSMQTVNGSSNENLLEALRILDSARAKDPKNIEVLFRAAEINLALKNKTAALDNLALIIYEHPVKRALLMARELSEELGRYQDALEYHRKLQAIGEDDQDAFARIKYKQLVTDNEADRTKLIEELRAFIKRNPSHAEGLERLADLEMQLGHRDEAAQLYIKTAKTSPTVKVWQQAARIWVKDNLPDKAIAAARSIAADASGEKRIDAEIELIRLYIALNMLEDAKRHCESFLKLGKQEGVTPNKPQMREFLALRGLCYSRLGEHSVTADSLKKLCEDEFPFDSYITEDTTDSSDAPAPRLSTP